ncbi:MAG: S41 family peptidase [Candidatus Eremiobacteraeota bacterium]|nr:S41 family peptidase [Candidatus Eremiobacteraeota bacterium]
MKRKLMFFLLWLLVGVTGFLVGTRLSSPGDTKGVAPSKPLVNAASTQASKITVSMGENDLESVFQVDITVVDKALQMLKEEYIDDINSRKLLSGALEGLRKRVASHKLKTDMIKPLPQGTNEKEQLNTLKKTYSQLLALYGGKVKEADLAYGALIGMMDALGDPYSVALEPKEYSLLNEQMSGGNYGGAGVYIELSKKSGNQLTVVEPIEGSPAEKAGLKPGDIIKKINGLSTKGIDLEVAAQRIRGEVGSTLVLTIERKGGALKDYRMKRDFIHVSSVTSEMKPGNIGYVRIRFFGNETDGEFAKALEQVRTQGGKGLILDLRNNGGGYISAAIDVCSKILQSGTLVVSVVNHRTGRSEVHKAYGYEQITMPMVVLVNDLSASAAEITAGAIKDTNTGILVGVRTFGKGSVQSIHELRDGGALKYTIAKYLTPKGTDINKKGIIPDVQVEMNPDKVGGTGDLQLQKALTIIKAKLKETCRS